jgi:hypothetical protein
MAVYTKDFDKAAAADKDYTVEWEDWLNGDVLATSTWVVPAGLTSSSNSIAGTNTIIWLAGGSLGGEYECENTVTTVGGRTDVAIARIRIK